MTPDKQSNYLQAIKASVHAGQAIMNIYDNDQDIKIELKNDSSPLTLADQESHRVICEFLDQSKIPILSEEGKTISYDQRKTWRSLWIVDPLDGTKEFIKRNGEFTVNIAYIENRTPEFGVIYVPVKQTLYFGIKNTGAYRLDNALSLENISSIPEIINTSISLPAKFNSHVLRVIASRSHLSLETNNFINKLKEKYGDVEIISRGSSLKLCSIAEASADIYPRFAPTMEWDTAAGQAIIEAAGGKVTLTDNTTPLCYNKKDLLNPFFVAFKEVTP